MARCCSRLAMGDILEDKITLPDRGEVVEAINNVDGKKARFLFKEARNAIFKAYPASVGATWLSQYKSISNNARLDPNTYVFRALESHAKDGQAQRREHMEALSDPVLAERNDSSDGNAGVL